MLLKTAEVMKLSRPRPSALQQLREVFFQGPGMDAPTGQSRPTSTAMVHGAMEHHLDVEQEGDLSSLLPWDAVDPMSRLLQGRLGFLLAVRLFPASISPGLWGSTHALTNQSSLSAVPSLYTPTTAYKPSPPF